jgi:hypothetical protein
MALNAPNDEQKRPPIQFSVGLESVLAKELEKALAESENMTLPDLLQWLLVLGLIAWAKDLSDKNEREKLEALLRDTKIVHVVERSDDADQRSDDDELGDPVESFKRGWDDAMNGRTMSREEFRRRMLEDGD